MLCILYAPSGTGKTSLISGLSDRFGWRVVRKVTTRPQRDESDSKATVSESEFHELARRGSLFNVKPPIFGHLYAELCVDMLRAIEKPSEYWVMDSSVEYMPYYEHVPCKRVVLVHRHVADTIAQLNQSGRHSRLEKVRDERRTTIRAAQSLRHENPARWKFCWYEPQEFDLVLGCIVEWTGQPLD